jgi:hypothetical protein
MLHARADYQGVQDWPHKRKHITTTIGEDEPVILFRAKDKLILHAIRGYQEAVAHLPTVERDQNIIDGLNAHVARIVAWQEAHPDIVKTPDMPTDALQVDREEDHDAEDPMSTADKNLVIDAIARFCHSANRGVQQLQPWSGIDVAADWDDVDPAMQESVRIGVRGVLNGNTPEQSHQLWCDTKTEQGWVYGPVKDPELKTHPCLVPYDQLPVDQQFKDHLFSSIVLTAIQHADTILAMVEGGC